MSEPAPSPTDDPLLAALVEEAGRKSSVCWLTYPGSGRARPAWHSWSDGAAYLVVARTEDSAEQPLPGLTEADRVTVTSRAKDSRERLIGWSARVTVLDPEADADAWRAAFGLLRGDRLNAADLAGLGRDWADSAAIVCLTPTGDVTESPGRMPTASGAATPPATPATTGPRLPWVLHRRASRSPVLNRFRSRSK